MSKWRWTSIYQARLELRDREIEITFKIGTNHNGKWWAITRIGDYIYCQSPDVFTRPEDAAQGAIKAAQDALWAAFSDVNNTTWELPPRPEEVKP